MPSVTLAIDDAMDIYREGHFRGVTVLVTRLLSGTLQRGDFLEIPIECETVRCSIMGFESFALWRSHPPAAVDDTIGLPFGVALFSQRPLADQIPRAQLCCEVTKP